MPRARQTDAIQRKLTQALSEIMSVAATAVQSNLTDDPGASETGTPVDTGWAYTNWLISVNTPVSAPVGSKTSVNTSAQQATASAISSFKLSAQTAMIFVSNTVPYITQLNLGTSRQQPAGFVQRAIAQALLVDLPGVFGSTYRS
jgi:hypothetical protein